MPIVPQIYEKASGGTLGYDIFSKLLKDRTIFAGGNDGAISTDDANMLIAELLYLEAEDPGKTIHLYINSPGGSVTAGLAIYDTMQHISSPVSTICMGMAMSFGAVLLCAGAKGKRFSLPNSRIMIHQPLISGGGIGGQETDIDIEAKEMKGHKNRLTQIIATHTGQTFEKVKADCERNYYMSPEEAVAYGLIDKVIHPKKLQDQEDAYFDTKNAGQRDGH